MKMVRVQTKPEQILVCRGGANCREKREGCPQPPKYEEENPNPGILCLLSRLLCIVQHTIPGTDCKPHPILNLAFQSCPYLFPNLSSCCFCAFATPPHPPSWAPSHMQLCPQAQYPPSLSVLLCSQPLTHRVSSNPNCPSRKSS